MSKDADMVSVPRALLLQVCDNALSDNYLVEQDHVSNDEEHATSEKERKAINALMKYAEDLEPPVVAKLPRRTDAPGYIEMSGVDLDGQGQATVTTLVAHRGAYVHLPPSPPQGRVMHHGDLTIGWDEP